VLFVVTGPSGCGKSTIIRRVVQELERLRFSISHTTRPKRPAETSGRDYYFISPEEFRGMVEADAFLEWATVHGHSYGTSRAEVESKSATADLVLDIDVQGARQVKKIDGLEAVFIFVVPSRFADLKERLERRAQDDASVIHRRLETAVREVEAVPEFEYVIINDTLDRAVEELKAIIRAGRCRVEARSGDLEAVLRTFREARLD
jgi:guanylate kinase